jgi:hypothetical protein
MHLSESLPPNVIYMVIDEDGVCYMGATRKESLPASSTIIDSSKMVMLRKVFQSSAPLVARTDEYRRIHMAFLCRQYPTIAKEVQRIHLRHYVIRPSDLSSSSRAGRKPRAAKKKLERKSCSRGPILDDFFKP